MIERLRTSLHALSRLSAERLTSPALESLRRDCADAVRLELDCRQLELGVGERAVLGRLSDLLESSESREDELAAAIRDASVVLGAASPDRTT